METCLRPTTWHIPPGSIRSVVTHTDVAATDALQLDDHNGDDGGDGPVKLKPNVSMSVSE